MGGPGSGVKKNTTNNTTNSNSKINTKANANTNYNPAMNINAKSNNNISNKQMTTGRNNNNLNNICSSSNLHSTINDATSGYDSIDQSYQMTSQTANQMTQQLTQQLTQHQQVPNTTDVEAASIRFNEVDHKRSYCWKWFKLSTCESKVKCNICADVMSFKSSTTAMINHLTKGNFFDF